MQSRPQTPHLIMNTAPDLDAERIIKHIDLLAKDRIQGFKSWSLRHLWLHKSYACVTRFEDKDYEARYYLFRFNSAIITRAGVEGIQASILTAIKPESFLGAVYYVNRLRKVRIHTSQTYPEEIFYKGAEDLFTQPL